MVLQGLYRIKNRQSLDNRRSGPATQQRGERFDAEHAEIVQDFPRPQVLGSDPRYPQRMLEKSTLHSRVIMSLNLYNEKNKLSRQTI